MPLADSRQRPNAIKAERFSTTRGDVTYLPDGNAIAGDPFAAFGRERTVVVGRWRTCGTAPHPQSPSCASTPARRSRSPAVPAVTPS